MASIAQSLRLRVLDESGFQCAHCGHRDGLNLTVHHIHRREEGGVTEDSNLIALCHNCHNRVHESKTILEKDIRRIKRHLVQQRLTQAGVNALRLAYSNSVGVVAAPYSVQHLVDDGLLEHVEEVSSYSNGGMDTPIDSIYRITQKGRKLAESWVLDQPTAS